MRALVAAMSITVLRGAACGTAGDTAEVSLEAVIPLGEVHGRIDHLAVDLRRRRLYVAELGNGSIGVVDLAGRRLLRRLTGLSEPQGIAYDSVNDIIYVSSGGDGSLRLIRAADLQTVGVLPLGNDADNVRVSADGAQVYVGYGNGAIARLDVESGQITQRFRLPGHPESFRLAADGKRIFVNVPDADLVAVLDEAQPNSLRVWRNGDEHANFPMIMTPNEAYLLVAYRRPARLVALDTRSGEVISKAGICGDADDLFTDAVAGRVYVSCGEGKLQVLRGRQGRYVVHSSVATSAGARTSLFVPEFGRIFVAVPAGGGRRAAIWVFSARDDEE
jgi:DNA-binding beta-propeller fold protein YncE